jgi:drug/metabolite transporter (DMT)-like permease
MKQYTWQMPQIKPIPILLPLAIAMAIFAISTASILIRFAQADAMPSIVIAALRLTFATVLLAPLVFVKYRQEIRQLTRAKIALGALSGLFLAVHFAAWISSLAYTRVASSAVLVSTGPLWVALLSPFVLNERVKAIATLGLILALAGGSMIALADVCSWQRGIACLNFKDLLSGQAARGNFLALLGAWAMTGYLILGRRTLAAMPLIPYIFLVYGMGAIFLVFFTLASGISLFGYEPKTYGWVLFLAIVPQLIGHSTFNWALKYLPATFVASSTLGEPVGAAILAIFILKEIPSIAIVLGGILILGGILLVSYPQRGS